MTHSVAQRRVLWTLCVILLSLLSGCQALAVDRNVFTGNILLWHSWPPEDAAVLDQVLSEVTEISPETHVVAVHVAPEELAERFIDATQQGVGPDILLAWIADGLVRKSLTVRGTIEPGVIESAVTITRYAMITVGVLFAMRILGMDLSTLAIIGGGLSVGIGFGMQRIIANFISGLILLFEQSLLPGDVVELNGRIGTVERVDIRSTTVRTINNVELVVPNENFMVNDVVTFTKTDHRIRVLQPFGVSYDSNPHEVRAIVQHAAQRHPLVLVSPEPDVLFRGFGDSSLDFELAFWIDRPEAVMAVQSDLYFMIWDTLQEHDIEIPFPQRDINLRRGWRDVFGEQAAP